MKTSTAKCCVNDNYPFFGGGCECGKIFYCKSGVIFKIPSR